MIFLIVYFAIGCIILAVIFFAHQASKRPSSTGWEEVANAFHPERATLRYRITTKVLLPILTGVLVLVAWPIMLPVALWKVRGVSKSKSTTGDEEKFSVARKNLLQQTTVEQIEQLERIDDPMGAAPALPFGHLNAAWVEFRKHLTPQHEIWTFSALWEPLWGPKEIREGYVAVLGNVVGPHFVTAIKTLGSP